MNKKLLLIVGLLSFSPALFGAAALEKDPALSELEGEVCRMYQQSSKVLASRIAWNVEKGVPTDAIARALRKEVDRAHEELHAAALAVLKHQIEDCKDCGELRTMIPLATRFEDAKEVFVKGPQDSGDNIGAIVAGVMQGIAQIDDAASDGSKED